MSGSKPTGGLSSIPPMGLGVFFAACAALCFGITTPFVQRLGHGAGPFYTAALLYTGSALVSGVQGTLESKGKEPGLEKGHIPRLAVMAFFGAVLAPSLLAWGLQHASGTASSLLLNTEAPLTALAAWIAYKEPLGARMLSALGAMLLGGLVLVLSSSQGAIGIQGTAGMLAIVGATLAWSIDNTVTRALSERNPSQVVLVKSALGAGCTVLLGALSKESLPSFWETLGLIGCGASGYGLSLRLYLLAQRKIGAARTGSVFSIAPFIGALVAVALGDRPPLFYTVAASLLFALGLWLHSLERHSHKHQHQAIDHNHRHRHDDAHHNHPHGPGEPEGVEHTHWHHHDSQSHAHPHAPDIHHQHEHS